MRTLAIVPIKSFASAKQRLAGTLASGSRRSLVQAMFSDVLGGLRKTAGIDGIADLLNIAVKPHEDEITIGLERRKIDRRQRRQFLRAVDAIAVGILQVVGQAELYLAIDAEFVAPAGDLTRVTLQRAGQAELAVRFALDRIGAHSARCS